MAQEDERPGLVAVEAPEPRKPEQPRRVEGPDAPDVDRARVQREPVEPRLRSRDRVALGRRWEGDEAAGHAGGEPSGRFTGPRDAVGTPAWIATANSSAGRR